MRRIHRLHTLVNRLLALSLTALLVAAVVLPARSQGLQSPLPRPGTCAAPATGMVAWWPGDGTARDIKGGNDGILQEGAGYSIGKVGAAFDFDGRSGFMSAGVRGLPVGDAPRTVETWVYTMADSWGHNTHTIFEYGESSFRRAFGIDMENYPQIEVYTYADDLFVDTGAPAEGWLHVAATYDETRTLRVYVNGVMRGIRQYPDGIDTAPSKVGIGKSPAALNGATYFGRIDEVGLYDRALTAEEVGSIYSAGDAGKCRYSVSGRITDTCGVATQDAAVMMQSGKLIRSTTTDAEGNYTFGRLPGGGDYVITPQVPAGQRGDFAPSFSAFASLSANQTADFFFRPFRIAIPCRSSFDFVSDLPWAGAIDNSGEPRRDVSVNGTPITLNGVVYSKGLGVHPLSNRPSEVTYNLWGGYSSFISDVGLDDETGAGGCGSVRFYVIGDGVTLYDSGNMVHNTATQTINVSVAGVQELKLRVTDAGDGFTCDHGDWANARLVR